MKLYAFPSYLATTRALIFRILELMMKEPERVFNIAFSGGGTPALLYELWANEYNAITPWNRMRIFFVDERCVPPLNSESNFKLINDLLLDKVAIPQANVFRIKGENEPVEEAINYSEIVERTLPKVNDWPQFDIVLLGIGTDGHTSSIFPGQENLLRSNQLYAESINPSNGQLRIALTGLPILNSKHVFFLVMGKNKAEVMQEILLSDCGLPAAFIARNGQDVEFYLDEAAAGQIH